MARKSWITLFTLSRICFLAMPLLCLLQGTLLAQDSTKAAYLRKQQPDSRKDSAELFVKKDSIAPAPPSAHSPRKAALFSAVVPGLGQAYNREYWKIPLVYAALGITTYTYIDNIKTYRQFRNAYRISQDGNADTHDPLEDLYTPAGLKANRDAFREYVDYSVLVFVLAYGLNILDATVFAHLRTFDMSDDLSIKVVPTIINNRGFGLSLRVGLGNKKKFNGMAFSR